jgi:hypothetical protein
MSLDVFIYDCTKVKYVASDEFKMERGLEFEYKKDDALFIFYFNDSTRYLK